MPCEFSLQIYAFFIFLRTILCDYFKKCLHACFELGVECRFLLFTVFIRVFI